MARVCLQKYIKSILLFYTTILRYVVACNCCCTNSHEFRSCDHIICIKRGPIHNQSDWTLDGRLSWKTASLADTREKEGRYSEKTATFRCLLTMNWGSRWMKIDRWVTQMGYNSFQNTYSWTCMQWGSSVSVLVTQTSYVVACNQVVLQVIPIMDHIICN